MKKLVKPADSDIMYLYEGFWSCLASVEEYGVTGAIFGSVGGPAVSIIAGGVGLFYGAMTGC